MHHHVVLQIGEGTDANVETLGADDAIGPQARILTNLDVAMHARGGVEIGQLRKAPVEVIAHAGGSEGSEAVGNGLYHEALALTLAAGAGQGGSNRECHMIDARTDARTDTGAAKARLIEIVTAR